MNPGFQINPEDFTFLSVPEPTAPASGGFFHCMSDLGYGIKDNDFILVDPDRKTRNGSLVAILTTAGMQVATYTETDDPADECYFVTNDSMIPVTGSVLLLGVIRGLYREIE